MGYSRFLHLLLVSSLIFLSFGYGFGRVALMETDENVQIIPGTLDFPATVRVKYEISDYADPQPNTNPNNGFIYSPPSPTPTPPPSA